MKKKRDYRYDLVELVIQEKEYRNKTYPNFQS